MPTKGIDIGFGQEITSAQQVWDAGYRFVYINAMRDGAANDLQAKNIGICDYQGLLHGCYANLLYTTSSPVSQAYEIYNTIKNLKHQLPFALWLVPEKGKGFPNMENYREMVDSFITHYYSYFKRYPLLFSNQNTFKAMGVSDKMKSCQLWIADYTAVDGVQHNPWETYLFAQVASNIVKGVPGVSGINEFPGSLNELKNYILNGIIPAHGEVAVTTPPVVIPPVVTPASSDLLTVLASIDRSLKSIAISVGNITKDDDVAV
jgi:hypothetical protein